MSLQYKYIFSSKQTGMVLHQPAHLKKEGGNRIISKEQKLGLGLGLKEE